jgi:glucans biosynthesis protein
MSAINRRGFLAVGLPWALALGAALRRTDAWAETPGQATTGPSFGPPQPFSYDSLRQRAAGLAKSAYVEPKSAAADIVRSIDFDAVQKIKFRADHSLWLNGPGHFPVRFFTLNKFVPESVKIHALSGNTSREILYFPSYFDFADSGLAQKLPADSGFSGFRVMDGKGSDTDWLAFQGASYFRSSGAVGQYGASARGIAANTALSTKEEFPRFTEFWLATPNPEAAAITIYALLDGPSLTGAYRFDATRTNAVVMDIHADLFIRADVPRLGLAPLTSMYWYGENDRRQATDWRPEIHDSDGLALWTGKGERIWRPLINPPSVQTNSFSDTNPKGFGLLQRDRNFADYQDDGAFYNRRPSIWVEPRGDWGAGAVQLVEIPTDDEIHDNIVAYWQPQAPVKAGSSRSFDYRLYWQNDEPHPPTEIGRVVSTRIGRGGVPGKEKRDDRNAKKFVIDFTGGPLADMKARFDVTPVVTLSRGKMRDGYVIKVVGTDRWRALVDVDVDGKDPLTLRCFLRLGDKTLTETWLYQYFPPG